jgi:transposase-like protein
MDRDMELPPVNVRRWTVRRKAAVVHAVRNGVLSVEEAAKSYSLSQEELEAWERDLDRHGLYGLRAKLVQAHRPIKRSRSRLHRDRAGDGSKSRCS